MSNYGSFSKIGRKNHYLEKLNSKNGRKFYYSQKLCFDKFFEWKEYNFLSDFLTNMIFVRNVIFYSQKWRGQMPILITKILRPLYFRITYQVHREYFFSNNPAGPPPHIFGHNLVGTPRELRQRRARLWFWSGKNSVKISIYFVVYI